MSHLLLLATLLLAQVAFAQNETKAPAKQGKASVKEAQKPKKPLKLIKKEDQISYEKNPQHKKLRKARLRKSFKRLKDQEPPKKDATPNSSP